MARFRMMVFLRSVLAVVIVSAEGAPSPRDSSGWMMVRLGRGTKSRTLSRNCREVEPFRIADPRTEDCLALCLGNAACTFVTRSPTMCMLTSADPCTTVASKTKNLAVFKALRTSSPTVPTPQPTMSQAQLCAQLRSVRNWRIRRRRCNRLGFCIFKWPHCRLRPPTSSPTTAAPSLPTLAPTGAPTTICMGSSQVEDCEALPECWWSTVQSRCVDTPSQCEGFTTLGDCEHTVAKQMSCVWSRRRVGKKFISTCKFQAPPQPMEEEGTWKRCAFEHSTCHAPSQTSDTVYVRLGMTLPDHQFFTLAEKEVSGSKDIAVLCTAQAFGVEDVLTSTTPRNATNAVLCEFATRANANNFVACAVEGDFCNHPGTRTIFRYESAGGERSFHRIFDGDFKCSLEFFSPGARASGGGGTCTRVSWAEPAPPSLITSISSVELKKTIVPENLPFTLSPKQKSTPASEATRGVILVVVDGLAHKRSLVNFEHLTSAVENLVAGGADPLMARRAFLTGKHHSKMATAGTLNGENLLSWLKASGVRVGHFGHWPFSGVEVADVTDKFVAPGPGVDLLAAADAFIENAKASGTPFYANVWPNRTNMVFQEVDKWRSLLPAEAMSPDSGSVCKDIVRNRDFTSRDRYNFCAEADFVRTDRQPCVRSKTCVKANALAALERDMRDLKYVTKKWASGPTILMVSSDTGEESPLVDAQRLSNESPFRGTRRSLYRGGVRVINRFFSHHLPRGMNHAFMSTFDWVPSVLQIFDVGAAIGVVFDGIDQSKAVLAGQTAGVRKKPVMLEWRYATPGECVNESPRLLLETEEYRLLVEPSRDFKSVVRAEAYSNIDTTSFEHNDLFLAPDGAAFKYQSKGLIYLLMRWAQVNQAKEGGVDPLLWPHLSCTVDPNRSEQVTSNQKATRPTTADALRGIILIMADDEGYGDIGHLVPKKRAHFDKLGVPYHYEADTPVVDDLARNGAVFTDFHTASAICTPTRASFLTGRNPSDPQLNLNEAFPPKYAYFTKGPGSYFYRATKSMPHHETIFQYLKDRGWHTSHYGKWHLGYGRCLDGYGVDIPFCFGCENQCYPDGQCPPREERDGCLGDKGYFDTPTSLNNERMDFSAQAAVKMTDELLDNLRARAVDGKRFYANLWFNAPHAPLNVPIPEAPWLGPLGYDHSTTPYTGDFSGYTVNNAVSKLSQLQVYRAFVKQKDEQIGRVVNELERLGLRDDTLIIYTSDNGPESESIYYGTVGSSGPFRGRKRSLLNGGHRVPFIMNWPAVIKAGTHSEPLTSSDFFKTMVRLADNTKPLQDGIGGAAYSEDFSCALFEKDSACHARLSSRTLFFEQAMNPKGNCYDRSPRFALRRGDFKYYRHSIRGRSYSRLFNTTADPLELRPLERSDPEMDVFLENEFKKWVTNKEYFRPHTAEYSGSKWTPKNDFFRWANQAGNRLSLECT